MVPHLWIIECHRNMFGIVENLMGEIQNSPKQWKTELMAGNQLLGEKRGVFQGDNLSPLLFILALILLTLSLVLRKVKAGYSLENGLPTYYYSSSSFHG